jgi:hypothetical protein
MAAGWAYAYNIEVVLQWSVVWFPSETWGVSSTDLSNLSDIVANEGGVGLL